MDSPLCDPRPADPVPSRLQVMLCHGTSDNIIDEQNVHAAHARLTGAGVKTVTLKVPPLPPHQAVACTRCSVQGVENAARAVRGQTPTPGYHLHP